MGRMTEIEEFYADRLLGFALPARNARGRMVRLDGVLDDILSAHDYPAPVTHLLAEALVLTALIGGLLKNDGSQMTMQAQTENGPISLLVCDFREGQMRGYVQFDRDRIAELGANPSLFALFGKGYLAMTMETKETQRYQGIVPLEGNSLAEACERYFLQSEQIPTLLRIAVKTGKDGSYAGGLLLQHLAEGEEGRERLHVRQDHPDWEHVSVMAGSTSYNELLDPALSLQALVWRLFHEEDEVRVMPGAPLSKGCRCSPEHYRDVLSKFPEEERAEMRNDDGDIVVDCAFCSKLFAIDI